MNNAFIGIGKNPEGKDLPLGFGMQLAQDKDAMNTYTSLSQDKRDSITEYIQKSKTGEDAISRIRTAVEGLKQGNTNFLS